MPAITWLLVVQLLLTELPVPPAAMAVCVQETQVTGIAKVVATAMAEEEMIAAIIPNAVLVLIIPGAGRVVPVVVQAVVAVVVLNYNRLVL